MSDWFLLSAGSYFLIAWSAVVAVVGVAAFGRDLFPSTAHLNGLDRPTTPVNPTQAKS